MNYTLESTHATDIIQRHLVFTCMKKFTKENCKTNEELSHESGYVGGTICQVPVSRKSNLQCTEGSGFFSKFCDKTLANIFFKNASVVTPLALLVTQGKKASL